MDPDAVLGEIRKLIRDRDDWERKAAQVVWAGNAHDLEYFERKASECAAHLVDLFQELDKSLSNGGLLPAAWRKEVGPR